MKYNLHYLLLIACVLYMAACQKQTSRENVTASSPENTSPATNTIPPLFALVPAEKTGITFSNNLTEGPNTNVLMYEYFYNGGGVAIGDLNNDGLDDIYFTANMSENKLYLNKGNMQFTDITAQSGAVGRSGPWKTGTTMADVNGDGLLDIYVCYSGKLPAHKRVNELYVNQGPDAKGIPHFIEQAQAYGIASTSYSTQAYFFDYDRDTDLDMLLLNHSPEQLPVLDEVTTTDLLKKPDTLSGTRLFLNKDNYFTDVSRKAGIQSSALSYGLGAAIGDVNGDNWPDIYIGNDYTIPDFLYINNKNGTFTNQLQKSLRYNSHFSMGNELADINNDGLLDIYTLDMLPEDNRRQKLLFTPDNYEKFDLTLRSGFYYQYMRNMLQVNNGNGTFSEIGQLAGVSNTDWSWGPLFADYDNDGWKDLFITNGYMRDFTNMDFMKFMGDYVQQKGGRMVRNDVLQLVHQMPASNVINYVFKNEHGQSFTKMNEQWGMNMASNSNGAAYADLDKDGDLDLVVNNINSPAFIYQNRAEQLLKHHYLPVQLQGEGKNTWGLGAKVSIYNGAAVQHLQQMPSRGFQSSVSPLLHFGLGEQTKIDSLVVVWQGGKTQVLKDITVDKLLVLEEKNARSRRISLTPPVMAMYAEEKSPVNFVHQDTKVNDFKRQPLLVNPLSYTGPCLVKADVNGDKLEDIYVGGGSGQAGALYIQHKGGRFTLQNIPAFEADKLSDDTDALFFDANGDTFLDLYVCSGGYDNFMPDDVLLQDRLYINDGKGNLTKSTEALPRMLTSTSCVRAGDVNKDGYPDLFVGGRVIPGRYPETPASYLLVNDGKGKFTDMTASLAPALAKPGMVTDAAWHDLNDDNSQELIIIGEWMPIRVFSNQGGKLAEQTSQYFSKAYYGWWNKLLLEDLNQDGKADLLVGNQGLNTQCKVSESQPAGLYYKDFDDNGSVDPVLCFYIQGKSYPYVTRDELLEQMSTMRTRFTDYKSYADASLQDIFTKEELTGAGHLKATYLQTALFIAGNGGKFREEKLPIEAQFSPVHALAALDYNGDGNKDLLLAGNSSQTRLRFGKHEANYGVLLKGDGKGEFTYIPQRESGFNITGDVRSILPVENSLLFGINGQAIKAYQKGKLIQ